VIDEVLKTGLVDRSARVPLESRRHGRFAGPATADS
jgi:hypothetical protein